jgi:membrane-associated protease RseP (regulator of RpoE activity)
MRRPLCLVLLTALACDPVAAQSGASESTPRAGKCEECKKDSSLRVMHRYQMRHRDEAERLSRLARELTAVRRSLEADGEISSARRRRLESRARQLESQLAATGAKLGIGIGDRALREIGPAMAEARQAIAAAQAEAAAAAPQGMRFQGWIGITLDAPSAVEKRGRDVYWRFFDHPEIVSVDPTSPAERAGIRQGDVLLAYNGRDVRQKIAMNRLLEPGRTLRVRVRARRDNEVRDLAVQVAPVHDRAWREWPSGAAVPGSIAPRSPRAPGQAWTVVVPEPGRSAIAGGSATTAAPMISIARVNGVAGAHMETITPGLGETIGIERGVLVISVPPGGPAHESGLVDGDVIVKADGRDVHTVHELRKLVAASDGRAIKLEVTRKRKVRHVTLHW